MRFAVIPTHDRPDDLAECLHALYGQVDYAIIIDNASSPPITDDMPQLYKAPIPPIVIMRDEEQPPNLSRLWNLGIDMAEILEGRDPLVEDCPDFWIAILNDDAIVPPGWMDSMVNALDIYAGSAACTDPFHSSGPTRDYGKRSGIPREERISSVYERMTGWAFVLDGQDGIRADEDLRWWYGDTAIDLMARSNCGMLMVPGPPVINKYPNSSTAGILAEQAGRDRAVFIEKYGEVPW